MHEKSEDSFGFGALSNSAKERIKHIRPAPPPDNPADMSKIDAVADDAGFVSREVQQVQEYVYRGTKGQRPEPRIPLNMRVPVSLGTAFQRFCEEERYSYPEGLAEILRRAGLPTK